MKNAEELAKEIQNVYKNNKHYPAINYQATIALINQFAKEIAKQAFADARDKYNTTCNEYRYPDFDDWSKEHLKSNP